MNKYIGDGLLLKHFTREAFPDGDMASSGLTKYARYITSTIRTEGMKGNLPQFLGTGKKLISGESCTPIILQILIGDAELMNVVYAKRATISSIKDLAKKCTVTAKIGHLPLLKMEQYKNKKFDIRLNEAAFGIPEADECMISYSVDGATEAHGKVFDREGLEEYIVLLKEIAEEVISAFKQYIPGYEKYTEKTTPSRIKVELSPEEKEEHKRKLAWGAHNRGRKRAQEGKHSSFDSVNIISLFDSAEVAYRELGWLASHTKSITAQVLDYNESWFNSNFPGSPLIGTLSTEQTPENTTSGGYPKNIGDIFTIVCDEEISPYIYLAANRVKVQTGFKEKDAASKMSGKILSNIKFIGSLVADYGFNFTDKFGNPPQDVNLIRTKLGNNPKLLAIFDEAAGLDLDIATLPGDATDSLIGDYFDDIETEIAVGEESRNI